MTKIDLGQTISILANVGVIAGFEAERESWREEANDPYFRDYNCRNRQRYAEAYIQEIDALIPSIG